MIAEIVNKVSNLVYMPGKIPNEKSRLLQTDLPGFLFRILNKSGWTWAAMKKFYNAALFKTPTRLRGK